MSLFFVNYSHKYASLGPKVQDAISITSGKKKCVAVVAPSMGFLERLVVSQVPVGEGGGTAVAFTVELLNSKLPFEPGEYLSAASAGAPLEHHRIQVPVTAALSANSGGVVSFIDDSFGTIYLNVDGSYTVNQNVIYLLISPTSAGTTTKWNVTIQGRTAPTG